MRRFVPDGTVARWFALGIGWLVCVACAPVDAPAGRSTAALEVDARLTGLRRWVETPGVGDGGHAVFDGDRLPAVLLAGEPPEDATLRITFGATVEPPLRTHRTADSTLLVVEAAADGWVDGPGTVQLHIAGRLHRSWPAAWAPSPEKHPLLAEVLARWRTDGARAALAVLDGHAGPLADYAVARAAALRSRLKWVTGERDGARDALVALSALAERRGWITDVAAAERTLADMERRASRFVEAEARLARAEALDDRASHLLGRARARYQRAIVAWDVGRFREAAALLEATMDDARRLDARRDLLLAAEMKALLDQDLGHHRPALDALAAMPVEHARPTERGRLALNRGWAWLRAAIAGHPAGDARRAVRAFEDARRLSDDTGDQRANLEASLALGLLQLDDRAGAEAALDRAVALDHDSRAATRHFRWLVEGELALADRRPAAAIAAFDRVLAVDVGRLPSERTWQALYGRARAAWQWGSVGGARVDLEAAVQAIDHLARSTPLVGARATFVADRRAPAEALTALLLAVDDVDGAFAVAAAAGARLLRAFEQQIRVDRLPADARARWDRHLDRWRAADRAVVGARQRAGLVAASGQAADDARRRALEDDRGRAFDAAMDLLDAVAPTGPTIIPAAAVQAALAPDEALLMFARLPRRWVAFVVTAHGLTATPVGATLAVDLLDAAPGLPAPGHVYVVPGGRADAFDLGLDAPWSVSFLPHAGLVMRPAASASGAPVVVADPRADLPFARASGEAVAARWPAARLLLDDTATRPAVLAAVDGARLMHFAGHGVLRADDPWDAHLALAGDARLDLRDVLVDRPTVGLVVLDGCETGPPAIVAADDRLGLPEAFLVAGADAVVATVRPVDDAEAARFVAAFFDAGGERRPAEALRRARAVMRGMGSDIGRAYRVIGGRAVGD